MPIFTVYTLGDVSSYWGMLNGVAMVFGLKGFWASAGLTGALLLIVMVLIYFLTKAGGGSGGHSPVLGPLYLGGTFVFMSINSSVAVQDIYTGNVIKVDNIPLIISLPSSLMTTAAYKVFTAVDTSFSTIDGSYMSVGSKGMESPLKLLLSLRKGFSTSAPNLALSMKVFAQSCTTGGGSNFSKAAYDKSKNGLEYLTTPGNFNPTGLTFDFPANSTVVVATNCTDEARVLRIRAANYMSLASSEGNPNTVIAGNMGSIVKPDGTVNTFSDAKESIQINIIGKLHASAQQSQDLMENMLYYDVINAGMDCAGVSTAPEASNACWTENAVIRQGLEKWKSESAASGTFFSKFMAQSVVFLQLMFFGFSPIILVTCLFMGEKSLGLFSKYLIFGGWTVSWLPFTCVIQMYIQNQIAARVGATSVVSIGGITPGNLSSYYDMISGNIALASDLMGMVPMLSLGLLTGSATAMAGMAKHFDKMSAAADASNVMSPNLVKNGPILNEEPRSSGNTTQLRMGGTGSLVSKISVGSSMSEARASAIRGMEQTQVATSNQHARLKKLMEQDGSGLSTKSGVGAEFSSALKQSEDDQKSLSLAAADTKSYSAVAQEAIRNGLKMGLQLIGAGVGIDKTSLNSADRKDIESWERKYNSALTQANQSSAAVSAKASVAAEALQSHSTGKTKEEATTLSESIAQTQAQSREFAKTIAADKTSGVSMAIDADVFGAKIAKNADASQLADTIYAGLPQETRNEVDWMANENMRNGRTSSSTAHYEAVATKLAQMGRQQDVDSLNYATGYSGPSGDANQNQNVGSGANGVTPVSAGTPSRGMDPGTVANQTVSQAKAVAPTASSLPPISAATMDGIKNATTEAGNTAQIVNPGSTVDAVLQEHDKSIDIHRQSISAVTASQMQGAALVGQAASSLNKDRPSIPTHLNVEKPPEEWDVPPKK